MKVNPLSEALMWLPGFGPGEDPLAMRAEAPKLTLIEGGKKPCSIAKTPRPAQPPKAVWPAMDAKLFTDLSGPVAKFEANLAALELLRELEAAARTPTDAERNVLCRFTGWGGLPQAFNEAHPEPSWRERNARLKAALSEAEYEAARASTPNAHYTSPEVVGAMWDAVCRMGFTGGRVLEPSSGVGYFLGAMPTQIAQASTVTAIELEPVSARIAKALYGHFDVRVLNQGFEATALPEGFFDLVISNVPFGNYKVADPRKSDYQNFLIHDYFIAKALEVARVGGLVAVITSAGTLDKHHENVRQYLANKADLVGAIRLPSSAFKAIAGTEVTTDMLFLRKRAEPVTGNLPLWAQSPVIVPLYDTRRHTSARYTDRLFINPYYADPGSDWVVGEFGMQGNGYGQTFAAMFEGDLAQALAERVGRLPAGAFVPRQEAQVDVEPRAYVVAAAEWIKPGAYVLHEGKVAVSEGHQLRVIEDTLPAAKVTRIKAMIPIRDAVRTLVAVQASTDDDGKVQVYRIALSACYDAFVKKHGFIHATMNQRAFREDPDFPLLLSLERWDEETQQAEKADIFHRRTVGVMRSVERCETPEEALLVCLAERARVVPSRIAELLETTVDVAMHKLCDMGLVFMDPASSQYVERDRYLSGNVRKKLATAEAAGDAYKANVLALTEVVPVDLAPQEIAVRLGSNWVPTSDYEAFIEQVVGVSMTVRYNAMSGEWTVKGPSWGVASTQTWGTNRVPAADLLTLVMNQQTPKVTDIDPNDPERKKRVVNTVETVAAREKLEALKAAFAEWVWSDESRAQRLARIYNDEFNSIVTRKFDGSHLKLPGFSMAYNLHPHQKDVIWRALSSEGNTLMAHAVGAGKTLSMICIGMEMRRVGLASKPCYAVPNHMLEQFAGEFLRAYPTANVLIASKDDMAPAKRAALLSRMATGDWDAVVITHSSFEKVPLPWEFVRRHIRGMLSQMEWAVRAEQQDGNTRAVKQLERAKKMWEARLMRLAAGKEKDDILDFAQIGFDLAVIDEAHLYKNLYRFTRLRMAGLPTNDSLRAFDMYLKTRYIMEKRGEEKGVVFATGTPIANSVAEMWVMQHYLQPGLLEEKGIEMFDAWAANFGEEVTALELAPDGSSYRLHSRFARFVNVPELMAMFREVADIRTKDMLNLPVPEIIRETVAAKPSAELKAYVEQLVDRAEKIRAGLVKDPRVDNMLKVTTDGRKAATDMRLIGGDNDDPGSKINLCVEKVLSIWHETRSFRGTQLVFLDMGTPGTGWSLYEDMRSKLCAQGVPHDEVAFIHEYDTDAAKERLFKATREGKVRVLFGSTSKMGVGTNVQTRLVALHHVDGPWRPADVEQREGRIERQGNLNKVARLYRYVTEGSFDAYVWQTLETKARFIAQVMCGDTSVRSIEDAELAALSYAEVKALASGNPLVIEKAGVDAEVMRLTMLKSKWHDQQRINRHAVATLPGRIASSENLLARMQEDVKRVPDTEGAKFRMELDGRTYTDRDDAGKRILGAVASLRPGGHKTLGTIGGFSIELDAAKSLLGEAVISLVSPGEVAYEVGHPGKSAGGTIRRIERTLATDVAEEAARMAVRLDQDRDRLEQLRVILDMPFEHESRLDTLLARKTEIDTALGIHEGDGSVEVEVAQAA